MPYNRTETLQRKLNACKSRNSRKPDPAIAIGKGRGCLAGVHRSLRAAHHSICTPFLDAPSHPELLGRLGRYEVERVIGTGGMGIVLKAHDTELHRVVAIKVLAAHLANSASARKSVCRANRCKPRWIELGFCR